MTKSFYWDSSVFNAWLNRESVRWNVCDAILKAAEEGQIRIVTSSVTYMEVYGYPLKAWQDGELSPEHMENAEAVVKKLFRSRYIQVVDLDRFIAERAHTIRRDTPRLRKSPIDAIHLASALMTSVEKLHTYDNDDLLQLSPFEGLPIAEPSWLFQMGMRLE